jgi:hypothetical protein
VPGGGAHAGTPGEHLGPQVGGAGRGGQQRDRTDHDQHERTQRVDTQQLAHGCGGAGAGHQEGQCDSGGEQTSRTERTDPGGGLPPPDEGVGEGAEGGQQDRGEQ